MLAGWTNFLAMIKGPSIPLLRQMAFNEKVIEFNNGVNKQHELQLEVNLVLRNDIEQLLEHVEASKRVEVELLKRIATLEQRL